MDKENIAKVVGKDLPISTKLSVEICNFIRYKELRKAKYLLQEIIDEKKYDICIFRYWLSQERLCPEVMKKDPMKQAIERVLPEAKGAIFLSHQLYDREESLETVLRWIR